MTKKIFILLLLFFIIPYAIEAKSTPSGIPIKKIISSIKKHQDKELQAYLLGQITPKRSRENPKVVALILTGTLGVFGAHRIYLGTDPKIPLFYTITLGGGLGVLPALDFIAILFAKDLTKYYHNEKVFMWS